MPTSFDCVTDSAALRPATEGGAEHDRRTREPDRDRPASCAGRMAREQAGVELPA